MTSLKLFHHPVPAETAQPEPNQWGTGKTKKAEKESIWTPKPPNWQYKGQPIEQYYTLTQLKLSNVRLNDQLLSKPQESEMHKIPINKSFPAEHPFSSHTSRFAVFPKFAECPEEEKRGFRARHEIPKNAEMPANAYDVQIVHKAKGNRERYEIQAKPPESLKRGLTWHGDTFDQLVKSPWGGQQSYYPTHPKTYVPNLEQRDNSQCIKGDMVVTPHTANAARNLERQQWQTTYDLHHTGLGPKGPLKIDNYDEKIAYKYATGQEDHTLYPHSVNTFDPPRPVEGRIARKLTPCPPPQTNFPDGIDNPNNYQRKMTLSELEEHRLLNGWEYVNLPEKANGDRWQELEDTFQPESNLENIQRQQAAENGNITEYSSPGTFESNESYLDKMRDAQHDEFQQVEASNRWKLLESSKPNHDLTALHHKLEKVSGKTEPHVFYDHEGKYQSERAGLYKTSYDPYKLQYSMNKLEQSGPELMDTHKSHVDALNTSTPLNDAMTDAIRWNRTLGAGSYGTVPQHHDQPSQHEAIGPFDEAKDQQKAALQPKVDRADVKTQENGIVLTESTYGDSYGTQKFLQENTLNKLVRSEPLLLMSNENQDLKNVRLGTRSTRTPKSGRSVQFNDKVMVAAGAGVEPIKISRAHILTPKEEQPWDTPRRGTGNIRNTITTNGYTDSYNKYETKDLINSTPGTLVLNPANDPPNKLILPVPIKPERKSKPVSFSADQFLSKSSNLMPSNVNDSWMFKTAYQSQYPGSSLDMSYKNDERFNWQVGCGYPRPQTALLNIQDAFVKSEVRRRFHNQFPEKNPDLRENIKAGKKHSFGAMNAQVLRGAVLVE